MWYRNLCASEVPLILSSTFNIVLLSNLADRKIVTIFLTLQVPFPKYCNKVPFCVRLYQTANKSTTKKNNDLVQFKVFENFQNPKIEKKKVFSHFIV